MKRDKVSHALFPLCAVIILICSMIYSEINMPQTPSDSTNEGYSLWKPDRDILPFKKLFESSSPWQVIQDIFTKPEAPQEKPKNVQINMRNDTDFKIDVKELLDKRVSVELDNDGVQVIIMHTHGTEAYTPHGDDTYKASDEYRTLNEDQSILRVGEELKRALEGYGIKTAHCTTLCDYPNYTGAYDRARETIEAELEKYPNAKIVIDMHRDAVLTASGGYYKADAQVNGKNAAQILFVVGTDGGGLSHPNWRDNMSFQLQIHSKLEELYPGITRPINVRASRFNQHFRTGSMLIEMGTCANYLEEAIYSAQLLADALADVLGKR